MSSRNPSLAWIRCRGRSGWSSPLSLPDGLAAEARNVHFYEGELAQKRGGMTENGSIAAMTYPLYVLYGGYVPEQNDANRELFGVDSLGAIGRMAGSSVMTPLTVPDALNDGYRDFLLPHTNFAQLNGKLYIAYACALNRLHVFDPAYSTTTIRRAGLEMPDAATVANFGAGTYPATLRYYRIAFTRQVGGVTVLRSLLGPSVSFTPSGAGSAARITRPALIGESETHWEVWGSTDDALYYGPVDTIAIGTTTADDSSTPSAWAGSLEAAPEEGANTPFPSVRYLDSDGVRLYGLGAWEALAQDSVAPKNGRLYFTPALDESTIHDDERIADTFNGEQGWIDLSRNGSGIDRGVACFQNNVYAFQTRGIYKFVPTGNALAPFRRVVVDTELGGESHKSIVKAVDEYGRPALYFLDPELGPHRIGADGVQYLGKDVKDIWDLHVQGAEAWVAGAPGGSEAYALYSVGVYYKTKHQIWWRIAIIDDIDLGTVTQFMLVYDVTEGRFVLDTDGPGVRGGWATWDGNLAIGWGLTMMSETLGASMSPTLKPYTNVRHGSTPAKLLKCDTGTMDDDVPYQAYLTSAAFALEPLPQHKAYAMETYVLATAEDGVSIQQSIVRNFGDESNRVTTVSLTPSTAGESRVLRRFQGSALTDAYTFQVQIGDASAVDSVWTLDRWYAPGIERKDYR